MPNPAEMIDLTALWQTILSDLQGQMTQATFSAWLPDTELIGVEDGRFIVSTHSKQAVEWLQHRLHSVVLRASQNRYPECDEVVFIPPVQPLEEPAHQPIPTEDDRPTPPQAYRFPQEESNWTRFPNYFCDVIMPNTTPSVSAFIVQVIRHTEGAKDARGRYGADWWEDVSYSDIQKVTNMSRTSVNKAIKAALAMGCIQRRRHEGKQTFDYALNWD